MILFPAVDIYNGNAVRLLGGDYNKVTVYGKPLEMAKRFEAAGAEWLHVVDLNGAEDSGSNISVIEEIVSKTRLKVQSGGGLRTREKVGSLLAAGAERVILGTVCAKEPEFVGQLLQRFGPQRIVCGLDIKDGKVAVKGWKENSVYTAEELGKKLTAFGAEYFLFTDISRDGMLTGANIGATAELTEKLSAKVIASGGVKDIGDLKKLKESGIYGAILGKAYYENKVDIKEAVKLCTS